MSRSRSTSLALAIAVIAGCASGPPPRKPGQEYLEEVKFEGNKKIGDKALLNGLVLHRLEKAGRAVDPYQVTNDANRLRGQYQREGYFGIDVQSRVERDNDETTVIYKIDEGTRATVRVRIVGLPDDPELPVARVRAALPLADGAPFVYKTYDEAKVKVLGVVQDAGYAHAQLDASVAGDLPTHTATITLAFTPGPKCRFGKVVIDGVDGDLKEAIQDRLHFAPGQTYSNSAVTQTQRDIYGMNRFSAVQVGMEPGDSAVVDMHVALSQSAPHTVTLGGGFGIDPISYEVRGRAGYQIIGWPFPLDTTTLDFRPAYAYLRDGTGFEPRVRAIAKIERQDLFLTHAIGSVEAGFTYLAYEAFTEYGPEGQLGYKYPIIGSHLIASVGYQIQRYDFLRPSVLMSPELQAQIHIDRPELLGSYRQGLVLDLRDNPIEPRLGLYAEMQLAEGGSYAGGQYQYEQVTPELRGYVPLGPVVFAARARYGAIYGDVPPTERYYAGGASSNRGFAERMLAPSLTGPVNGSTITVPYGGAGMIDTSIETRFPITKIKKMPLEGVVFLDGGDVTNTPAELNLGSLDWAAGLGLRLFTIVGPVRADFGYRLNHKGPMDPEPNTPYAFHLSLGEAF
ncbi:MAG: BamA/TamA family outer membrane protein [Deltaproteobacteria bacterium]